MDERILLLLALAITACTADDSSEKINENLLCTSDYLKAKGLLDSKFRVKSAPSNVSTAQCEAFISKFNKLAYAQFDEEFKEDLPDIADCLLEKVEEIKLADSGLIMFAINGAADWGIWKQRQENVKIQKNVRQKIEILKKVCASATLFTDLFDELCSKSESGKDSSSSEDDTPVDDYCIRKFMTENNFINTTLHQIDLNPKKVDVSAADCDQLISKYRADLLNGLKKELELDAFFVSDQKKNCYLKSVNDSKYFEAIGKVIVLCEASMTPEIKAFERDQFLKKMEFFYDNMNRC